MDTIKTQTLGKGGDKEKEREREKGERATAYRRSRWGGARNLSDSSSSDTDISAVSRRSTMSTTSVASAEKRKRRAAFVKGKNSGESDASTRKKKKTEKTPPTAIKQIGNILIKESIKKHDADKKKDTKDFLKLFIQDVAISVNKAVIESQTAYRRRKNIELPSMDDIKKIHSYLQQKRTKAFEELTQNFSKIAWVELAETTLIFIQLFNRRRPGEVKRILIDDFRSYQAIDENTDVLFKSLTAQEKEKARKYIRFAIRGKLNRTVPVLLDRGLLQSVELLLAHRKDAHVSDQNPYVFGIHSNDKSKHKYLRACTLLRKFSVDCGAMHPERLRGTKLRKHIATTCINLNLSEHEVADLADFMGHADKIHKDIYRQPVINREITRMSKLLEAAQGADEDESDDADNANDDNSTDVDEPDAVEEGDNTSVYEELPRKEPVKTVNVFTKRKRFMSQKKATITRTRWTEKEKQTIYKIFGHCIKNMTLPQLSEISRVIQQNPCLKERNPAQVKTWIHNQFRATKQQALMEDD